MKFGMSRKAATRSLKRFSEFKELSGEYSEEFKVEWPKEAVVKTTKLAE